MAFIANTGSQKHIFSLCVCQAKRASAPAGLAASSQEKVCQVDPWDLSTERYLKMFESCWCQFWGFLQDMPSLVSVMIWYDMIWYEDDSWFMHDYIICLPPALDILMAWRIISLMKCCEAKPRKVESRCEWLYDDPAQAIVQLIKLPMFSLSTVST